MSVTSLVPSAWYSARHINLCENEVAVWSITPVVFSDCLSNATLSSTAFWQAFCNVLSPSLHGIPSSMYPDRHLWRLCALLLILLKFTGVFQTAPACYIKVYGPYTAFKDKGVSVMHSCGGGGWHSHERQQMEIFWWDNAFTRSTNNCMCACLCISERWAIPALLSAPILITPCWMGRWFSNDAGTKETQIFLW